MKTEIINLGSVVKNGVGPKNGAINLIYSYLLQEYGLNLYNRIKINQIGDDLEELIMREYKNIHISIRYPADPDYDKKTISEKNNFRLNIIHAGLLRLAHTYNKLDVDKLEAIRSKILENNFLFDIPYKSFINPKQKNQVAKIIIHPQESTFTVYVTIEENGQRRCRILLYNGRPTDYYITAFFSYGKWYGNNKVVISGKYKEVEMHVDVNKCNVDIVNLSRYEKPPFFEMMRSEISESDHEKAHQNWLDSLPPGMADFIRENGT
jgi:hypothetical protein